MNALVAKHEQIQDALEHLTITAKQAEQMNQTLKGIMGVAKLEMQFFNMLLKFGNRSPVPRSPLLRSVVGLDGPPSATDASKIQALLPSAHGLS